ncbi:hypothetical protein DFJ73DRAFT_756123 [Zopfochytrium polystomum]|nr:hypothetical protein DFJ73DRAFT_756123 [Zopfochytrium polystomum]
MPYLEEFSLCNDDGCEFDPAQRNTRGTSTDQQYSSPYQQQQMLLQQQHLQRGPGRSKSADHGPGGRILKQQQQRGPVHIPQDPHQAGIYYQSPQAQQQPVLMQRQRSQQSAFHHQYPDIVPRTSLGDNASMGSSIATAFSSPRASPVPGRGPSGQAPQQSSPPQLQTWRRRWQLRRWICTAGPSLSVRPGSSLNGSHRSQGTPSQNPPPTPTHGMHPSAGRAFPGQLAEHQQQQLHHIPPAPRSHHSKSSSLSSFHAAAAAPSDPQETQAGEADFVEDHGYYESNDSPSLDDSSSLPGSLGDLTDSGHMAGGGDGGGGNVLGLTEGTWDPSTLMARLGSKQLDFTDHEKPTLFTMLKPYVPDRDTVNEEYRSFQVISGWLLGSPEACLAHFAHWRPAVRIYQFITPRLLGLPKVDLKMSRVSAKLRRSILLVASMQYRCHYCAAHAAAMGDLLKGSHRAVTSKAHLAAKHKGKQTPNQLPIMLSKDTIQYRNAALPQPLPAFTSPPSPPDSVLNPDLPLPQSPVGIPTPPKRPRRTKSATEADVLRLVTAASRIPSKVTPDLKLAALQGMGEDGYQTVACIAAIIGWTNGITDTIGMELGVNDMLFAKSELSGTDWNGARHAPQGFQEAAAPAPTAAAGTAMQCPTSPALSSASTLAQPTLTPDQVMQAIHEEVTPRAGLSRLADYHNVLSHVSTANAQADRWTSHVPNSLKKVDEWVKEGMGFLPNYLTVMKNLEAKRAVALMIWVFLVRNNQPKGGLTSVVDPCVEGEPCEWSAGAKALMFYVYTTKTGNLLLRGHAAFLAIRSRVPIAVLLSTASDIPTNDRRLDAALDLVRAAASLRRSFPATLNHRVLDTAMSTRGVMELVNCIGVFNMLHRLSAILAPEPVAFEKEVADFLAVFAPVLGMDPDDASPQDKEQRKVVDPLQFLYD